MNKKILKIVFLFLFIFTTNHIVNAEDGELVCSPASSGDKVTIKEKGPRSTGWEAKIPLCVFNGAVKGYQPYAGQNGYSDAIDKKTELTYREFTSESWDAKSTTVVGQMVPVCDDSKAYVDATSKCKAKYTQNINYYSYANCNEDTLDKDGCEEDEDGNVTGTYEYYNPHCDTEGYVIEDHLCVKYVDYIYNEERIDGDKTVNDAVTACESANSGATCFCEKIDYILQCPMYTCDKEYQTIKTCVPTYELPDGSPAYCVNPSQGFNGDYQVDTSFDVNKCASSNSTIDCGYANILIEAEYHRKKGENVDDEAINLALRLWGAHSGQNGYSKTGVANLKGCNCDETVLFLTEGNDYVNIYKYTHNYIMNKFKDLAYKYDYIPPENTKLGETIYGDGLANITCNSENSNKMLGTICGNGNACGKTSGNASVYRQAIDLYFNTLIGNKDMKNHLNDIVGVADTEPDGVNVIQGEETGDGERRIWLELDYSDFNQLELEEVVYNCKELDKIPADERAKIEPYCKTTIYLVDENGNRLKDSNGNVFDPIGVEECRKGSGCTTEEFSYAVCERDGQEVTPIHVKIEYVDNGATGTVQKYQSCARGDLNQVMFGLIRDDDSDSDDTEDDRIINSAPVVTRGEKTVTLNIYCNGSNTCNETGVNKSNNFGSCQVNNNGNLTYTSDETYTNYIKDPSLKCIVNMNNTSKQTYDYSEHFGVNTNLCRVYCSDEVEFVLANKINAVAGETFTYDIELAAYKEKKSDHKLSSIVKEKRTCVSEIYYNKNFPSNILEKIKSDYNLTDAEAEKSKNISSLLNTLMTKSNTSEGGRKEVVNQLLFDLYNCNIYKDNFDSKIKTPKNSANTRIGKDSSGKTVKYNKVYDYVKYLYNTNENNYGLNKNCTLNTKTGTNTCINMSNVNYEFGAETTSSKVNNVNLTSAIDSLRTSISNVQYCTDYNKSTKCLYFDTTKDKQDYDYNNNNNWSNTSTNGNPTFFGSEYTLPINDYAMFEVSVDVGFYNNETYQTKPGSGIVVDLSKEESNSNYLTLDKYQYPISKNALTFDTSNTYCKIIGSDTNSITKRCDITQVLGASELNNTKIYTYYRKLSNDQFFREVNSSNNRFKCVIDVRIPKVTTCNNCNTDVSTLYRNANESNLFPNGVLESSNWATVEGQIATNEIESTSDRLRTSNDLLDYSIELSTTQIRALKEDYNQNNKDYVNEPIDNCIIENNTYRNCRSTFLEILRGNSTELGTTKYGTLNETYNGSKYFGSN